MSDLTGDEAWEQGMRYFIEVTEAEANHYEDTGSAKVALGASGHAHRPQFGGKQCGWLLMKTTEVRAEESA